MMFELNSLPDLLWLTIEFVLPARVAVLWVPSDGELWVFCLFCCVKRTAWVISAHERDVQQLACQKGAIQQVQKPPPWLHMLHLFSCEVQQHDAEAMDLDIGQVSLLFVERVKWLPNGVPKRGVHQTAHWTISRIFSRVSASASRQSALVCLGSDWHWLFHTSVSNKLLFTRRFRRPNRFPRWLSSGSCHVALNRRRRQRMVGEVYRQRMVLPCLTQRPFAQQVLHRHIWESVNLKAKKAKKWPKVLQTSHAEVCTSRSGTSILIDFSHLDWISCLARSLQNIFLIVYRSAFSVTNRNCDHFPPDTGADCLCYRDGTTFCAGGVDKRNFFFKDLIHIHAIIACILLI